MACSCSRIRLLPEPHAGHPVTSPEPDFVPEFGKRGSSRPPSSSSHKLRASSGSASAQGTLSLWCRSRQDRGRWRRLRGLTPRKAPGHDIRAKAAHNPEGNDGTSEPACSDDIGASTESHPHTRGRAQHASQFRHGRRALLGTVLSGLALSVAYSSFSAAEEGATLMTTVGAPPGPLKNLLPSIPVNPIIGQEKKSRIYDATVLGEPVTISGDRTRVWDRLLGARVVYLGESELVPDPDDKLLELEIVGTLREKCLGQQRAVVVALDAFPLPLQPQLDEYVNEKLTDDELRLHVPLWPEDRWGQVLPLLKYCRDNGVRVLACGTPAEVMRTIQASGVQALTEAEQKIYMPRSGSRHGALTVPFPVLRELFQRGPYQFAQARIVSEYTMANVVDRFLQDGGAQQLLILITGASHVQYGQRGSGVPARVPKLLQKRTQVVVLLNPERQRIRQEGDVPEADFLWYSPAKGCTRNCFNRAEVARVMDAAGRRRDALPQDLQAGLEQGLVSPEVLQSFFDLDQQPIIADLTRRFQGLRERWLADPRFLQRLAIEESISITTTLFAQYERRGARFWKELDYVITDSVRGAVVDFFTVWLPAPTLSFRSSDTSENTGGLGALLGLKGLLGSVPDNAFQRPGAGDIWDLKARVLSVVVGGGKLFGVGAISSVATVAFVNASLAVRQSFGSNRSTKTANKRSPIFKTALVYGSFLGTSANLRYQAIAGLVEHWGADYFLASEPLAGSILSFVARIANSYWGTQQWVDLARFAGLQANEDELPSQQQLPQPSESNRLEPGRAEELDVTQIDPFGTTPLEAFLNSSEELRQEQTLENTRGLRK